MMNEAPIAYTPHPGQCLKRLCCPTWKRTLVEKLNELLPVVPLAWQLEASGSAATVTELSGDC